MTALFRRSFENFLSVLLCWMPSYAGTRLHTGPGDIIAAAFAVLLAGSLTSFFTYNYVSVNAVYSTGGSAFVYVAAAVLALAALRSRSDLAQIAVGLLWAMVIGAVLAARVSVGADLYNVSTYALRSSLPFLLPCCLFLICRAGLFRGGVAAVFMVLPGVVYLGEWAMMEYLSQEDQTAAVSDRAPYRPDTEVIYAAQPERMARAIDGLRPSDPDKVEMFAVLGAGYAHERVFRREVEAVGYLLERSFGAEDRVVRLVNDQRDTESHPLMNRVNLRASLAAVGQAMGDEDILMLFLTSHGWPEQFSLSFPGVISRDLSPADLNAALDAAGIGNAVLIVSACYSGSFIEPLSRPNRLVLTASASDRNSFGCSDENEWTDWGRAFFTQGLVETADPRQAASIARALVATWEAEQGLTPSQPQISEGADIGPVLDAWVAGLSVAMPAKEALQAHALTQSVGSALGSLLPPSGG